MDVQCLKIATGLHCFLSTFVVSKNRLKTHEDMKTHFDSVKINGMATECGSCCSQHAHHEDCGCNHHHAHDHSGSVMIRPLLSFCMLVAGIVMKQTGLVWFQNGIVPVLWYLFSFLPVGWPVIKEAGLSLPNRGCFY